MGHLLYGEVVGLFSFTDQELAAEAVEKARAAEGRYFSCRLRTGVGSKNDADALLNLAINGIAEQGWDLRSVTPFINTIGPNNEVVLLTFERR